MRRHLVSDAVAPGPAAAATLMPFATRRPLRRVRRRGPRGRASVPGLRRRRAASRGPSTPLRVFEDNALVRQALEMPGAGRVLVVDGGGSLRSALVGGNLAALAHRERLERARGVRLHPRCRGARGHAGRREGAPRRSPRRSAKAGAGERGVPVTFAGVTFAPGCQLYADRDGIVVADRNCWRDGARIALEPALPACRPTERQANGPSRWTGRSHREVVDRPLSLRRQADVPAPPFFDLPLSG